MRHAAPLATNGSRVRLATLAAVVWLCAACGGGGGGEAAPPGPPAWLEPGNEKACLLVPKAEIEPVVGRALGDAFDPLADTGFPPVAVTGMRFCGYRASPGPDGRPSGKPVHVVVGVTSAYGDIVFDRYVRHPERRHNFVPLGDLGNEAVWGQDQGGGGGSLVVRQGSVVFGVRLLFVPEGEALPLARRLASAAITRLRRAGV